MLKGNSFLQCLHLHVLFGCLRGYKMTSGLRSRNMSMKIAIWILALTCFIVGLAVSTPAMEKETVGFISISVRDVTTGYALPAFVSISKVEVDGSVGPIIDSFQVTSGEILKSYPPGKYIIELQMEGYKPMKSWFVIEAGKKFRDRYMLSLIESEAKELEKQLKAEEAAIPTNMAI